MSSLTSPGSNPPAALPVDPLASLRDIHLPDPVSAAPAWGWWLLAALLALATIAAVLWWWQWRRRNAYRRRALQLLQEYSTTGADAQQLQAINQLLKRTALHACPQQPVAQLHGQAWSEFLQQTLGHNACDGSDCFGDNLYRAAGAEDMSRARQFAAHWIRHHRAPAAVPVSGGRHA
ncbi:DUF4381 domain-containing protein [Pseudomaricurvus sp. HS19]|uniref:DUF4381 domain-containing protein n=1 Tax=Pseudomaricurvus sp. HS19 TaxID=2692626 RepID=UPI0013682E68|nr:DUF4381 domain-containing protein [Pseudomaricurvus sp. HS19]MYM61852.1 DUF4381 family protein [Pseudomaricurvus sp. HS19]